MGVEGNAIGVGIVGAGTIGTVHAGAVSGLTGARLVAIAEPREEAGRTLADTHNATWCPTVDDLLARSDVEVVLLATPSGMHAEQAVQVARAGKHVVTEKPMATTLADADRMIDACQAAGVALAVIFQTRFQPDNLRLKRAVEAGRFGQVVLGNALVHWHRSQEYYDQGGWRGTWALDGGGALINQSIHTIDLLQWIVGPVESVAAETAALSHRIEAEDTASASIRFAGGALGVIQGTTSAHQDWPARIEIVGTEGRAVLEAGRLTFSEPDIAADSSLLSERDLAMTAAELAGSSFVGGHQRQLREIFAALRAGEQPPVPGAEGRRALAIILGIYESARSGRRVTVG